METQNVPVNSGNTQNSVPPKSNVMKWSLIGGGGLLLIGLLSYVLSGGRFFKGELKIEDLTTLQNCVTGIDKNGLTEKTNYPLTINENCKDGVQMVSDNSDQAEILYNKLSYTNPDNTKPLLYQFTVKNNLVVAPEYIWDFGDGSDQIKNGKNQSEQHLYVAGVADQVYTASVSANVVVDGKNINLTATKKITVPKAAVAVAPTITANFTCNFLNVDADPAYYDLKFIDNSKASDAADPVRTGQMVNVPKNYDVITKIGISSMPDSTKVKIADLGDDFKYTAGNKLGTVTGDITAKLSDPGVCTNLPAQAPAVASGPDLTFTCTQDKYSFDYTCKANTPNLTVQPFSMYWTIDDKGGYNADLIQNKTINPLNATFSGIGPHKIDLSYTAYGGLPKPGITQDFNNSMTVNAIAPIPVPATVITANFGCNFINVGQDPSYYNFQFTDKSTSSNPKDPVVNGQITNTTKTYEVMAKTKVSEIPVTSVKILDLGDDFKYTASNGAGTVSGNTTAKLSDPAVCSNLPADPTDLSFTCTQAKDSTVVTCTANTPKMTKSAFNVFWSIDGGGTGYTGNNNIIDPFVITSNVGSHKISLTYVAYNGLPQAGVQQQFSKSIQFNVVPAVIAAPEVTLSMNPNQNSTTNASLAPVPLVNILNFQLAADPNKDSTVTEVDFKITPTDPAALSDFTDADSIQLSDGANSKTTIIGNGDIKIPFNLALAKGTTKNLNVAGNFKLMPASGKYKIGITKIVFADPVAPTPATIFSGTSLPLANATAELTIIVPQINPGFFTISVDGTINAKVFDSTQGQGTASLDCGGGLPLQAIAAIGPGSQASMNGVLCDYNSLNPKPATGQAMTINYTVTDSAGKVYPVVTKEFIIPAIPAANAGLFADVLQPGPNLPDLANAVTLFPGDVAIIISKTAAPAPTNVNVVHIRFNGQQIDLDIHPVQAPVQQPGPAALTFDISCAPTANPLEVKCSFANVVLDPGTASIATGDWIFDDDKATDTQVVYDEATGKIVDSVTHLFTKSGPHKVALTLNGQLKSDKVPPEAIIADAVENSIQIDVPVADQAAIDAAAKAAADAKALADAKAVADAKAAADAKALADAKAAADAKALADAQALADANPNDAQAAANAKALADKVLADAKAAADAKAIADAQAAANAKAVADAKAAADAAAKAAAGNGGGGGGGGGSPSSSVYTYSNLTPAEKAKAAADKAAAEKAAADAKAKAAEKTATGDNSVSRFATKDIPDIKTDVVTVPAIKATERFNCLPTKAVGPKEFSDTSDNTVALLSELGIVQGFKNDGGFIYDGSRLLTRGEALKVFSIANCIVVNAATSNVFSDVTSDKWFAPFVEFAKNANIINGYDDGTFRPDDSITRIEALKILGNFEMLNKFSTPVDGSCSMSSIVDMPTEPWAIDAAKLAFCNHIIGGKTINGKLYILPNEPLDRNAMSVLVTNYLSAVVNASRTTTK